MRRLSLCVMSIAALTGCQPPDEGVYIEAYLRGDHDQAVSFADNILVRAVPDHRDGFLASRPYHGIRHFEDQCPIDHVEFPLDFALFGSDHDVLGSPERWIMLAWMTDDTEATWPAPGELYGVATFEYAHDPYFGYYAEGIVVNLEHVR
jgi:hypothetical protein